MRIKITARRNLSNEAQALLLKGKRINWFIRLHFIHVRFANRKVHFKMSGCLCIKPLIWNKKHIVPEISTICLYLVCSKKILSCALFLHSWENITSSEAKNDSHWNLKHYFNCLQVCSYTYTNIDVYKNSKLYK